MEASRAVRRRRRLIDGLDIEAAWTRFLGDVFRAQGTALATEVRSQHLDPAAPGALDLLDALWAAVSAGIEPDFVAGAEVGYAVGIGKGAWRFDQSMRELTEAATFTPPKSDGLMYPQYYGFDGKRKADLAGSPFGMAADQRTVDWIRREGATLVRNVDDTTRATLRGLLEGGKRDGLSTERMARAIISRFDYMAVGRPQQHIDSRAHLIAVTETAKAYEYGSVVRAQRLSNGAGIVIVKSWLTTGDGRVDEDCLGNEIAGEIGLDDVFPSGHSTPPAHPACRCTNEYRPKTSGELGIDLNPPPAEPPPAPVPTPAPTPAPGRAPRAPRTPREPGQTPEPRRTRAGAYDPARDPVRRGNVGEFNARFGRFDAWGTKDSWTRRRQDAAFKGVTVNANRVHGLGNRVRDDIQRTLVELDRDLEGIPDIVGGIGVDDAMTAYAETRSWPKSGMPSSINVSGHYFRALPKGVTDGALTHSPRTGVAYTARVHETMANDIKVGWHPTSTPVDDAVKSIIDHEVAHALHHSKQYGDAIDDWLDRGLPRALRAEGIDPDEVRVLARVPGGIDTLAPNRYNSKYGMESKNEQWSELFAEARSYVPANELTPAGRLTREFIAGLKPQHEGSVAAIRRRTLAP